MIKTKSKALSVKTLERKSKSFQNNFQLSINKRHLEFVHANSRLYNLAEINNFYLWKVMLRQLYY